MADTAPRVPTTTRTGKMVIILDPYPAENTVDHLATSVAVVEVVAQVLGQAETVELIRAGELMTEHRA